MQIVLVALAVGMSGCAYFRDRGNDALDMVDIGLTFTKTPQFALYYRLPVPVAGLGYGKVDGYFLGIGGGNIGLMRHHEKSVGALLWCSEQVAFGDFDPNDAERLNDGRVGAIGLFEGRWVPPGYFLGCPHYLHLGWIGAVGTPRVIEWADFVLGFTTLDICRDDGRPRGYWPWETPGTMTVPEELRGTQEYLGRGHGG